MRGYSMTRKLCILFSAVLAVPLALSAQDPPKGTAAASTPKQAAAAPTANPIATSNSRMYTMLTQMVVTAAEKMPEEHYSFRPAPDVRTFGQLVGHLADSQSYFCATASGDSNPGGGVEKSKTSKADLVAALKESVAYCTKKYEEMTDMKGGEMIKMMNLDFARLTVLSANTAPQLRTLREHVHIHANQGNHPP
jgi:hypothetical protein